MAVKPFISKGIYTQYFHYFIPTTLSMVMYSLYCFADVFFVSIGVGKDGLAALNISLPIFTVFSAFGMMIGVGTAVTCAIFQGLRDYDNADRTFTLSIATTLISGTVITILFYVFLDEILLFLGADATIIDLARSYMLPVGGGTLFNMLSCVLTIVIRCDGNPRLAMIAGLAGNFTNIFLDYVFVILLNLGIFGAGLATAIGPIVSICVLVFHFILKENKLTFKRNFFKFKILFKMFANGVSASILELSTGVVTLLINLSLMRLAGSDGVAIFSVISNIAFIGKNLFSGTAQAAQPMISRRYAQKHYTLLKQANRIAMLTALILGISGSVLIWIFAPQIISFFIDDPSVLENGVEALHIFYSTFAIMGLNTVLMYYFQSIEYSIVSGLLAMLRGIILVATFLNVLPNHFGINGVWISVPLAESVTFAIFFVVLLVYNLRHNSDKATLEHELSIS